MPLSAGARLGPYEIVSALGAGGMGEVYRATDTRLHRTVAIKIIPHERVADEERKRRFLQEARAASALNHPSIVAVYDIASDGGVDFLVMEYVPGETLARLIPSVGLPPARAIDYARQMAEALAIAHAAGIVHRDVKPANVMVAPGEQVKILDFGLAKLADPAPAPPDAATRSLEPHTRPDTVLGTTGYMSPEQARGEPADPRSDIFSLGCVLYEMTTGTPPFARATAADGTAALLKEDPPAAFHDGRPIAAGLDRLIRRCLEKSRDARFATAGEVAEQLRSLSAAGAPPSPQAAPRFSRRHLLVGAGAAALVAGGGAIALRLARPGPFRSLAVLPLVNDTGDPGSDYVAEGISQHVINRLSQTTLKVTPFSTALRMRQRGVDAMSAARELNVAAVMTGRVTKQGGSLVIQAELVDTADGSQMWGDSFARPLGDIQGFEGDIARRIAETLRLRLTATENAQLARHDTRDPEAHRLYLQGQFYWNKFTDEGFVKAIDAFTAAIERDPNYALAYAGLAHAYAIQGADTYVPTRDVMPRAIRAATKALALDDALAEAHNALGICHLMYEWDWPGAQREFQRALALDPDSSNTLHFYSHYLEATGRLSEAVDVMRRAVDLDPLALVVNAEYGYALYCARRYVEALAVVQQTLDMDRGFIFGSWYLAQILERLGRFDAAIAELERVRPEKWEPVEIELACAHAAAGRPQEARRIMAGVEARGYLDSCLLASAYAELHDPDTTFLWLDRAYDQRSSQLSLIQAEPKFDPVRGDPRFTALLKKMKLA